MSNVSALLVGKSILLADSACLERDSRREPVVEEYLRLFLSWVPRFKLGVWREQQFVKTVNSYQTKYKGYNDENLVSEMRKLCGEMRNDGFIDRVLAPAFAIIREASIRTLSLRHHDVQLIGGRVLLHGKIAEMETGEGKTLVATLAACTAASTGASVHVITVNDYLAERDAKINSPLYCFFGLTVGVIKEGMSLQDRARQYACDVVYVSNKEIVFDYLKDRIASGVFQESCRLKF